MTDSWRVMLYSHDSQGLGHLRRNLALAHHIARVVPERTGRRVAGLMVSGLAPMFKFPLPDGFDWITIPGVAKGADGYVARHLDADTTSLVSLRSGLLEAALSGFGPDLVIIDRHIYGVWKELREPLLRLHAMYPAARVVLGLREVLDTPEVAAAEWAALGNPDALRRLVDEVWVYGDPAVHDLVETGEAPPALADRIRFTGFLATGREVTDLLSKALPRPFVLTTAGGGSDGPRLLRAAAAMTPPPGHHHVLVTGPEIDDASYADVAATAHPHTQVHRHWPGLSRQIAQARAVVSMGGYNTVSEILATDTPALIVPREVPRLEQLIRAQALRQVGATELMRLADVSGEALTAWVADAVTRRVDRSHVARDGLEVAAGYAADLLTSRRGADGPPTVAAGVAAEGTVAR